MFFVAFFFITYFNFNVCGGWMNPIKRFNIRDREFRQPVIYYKLPDEQKKTIQKLNGFFGMIGPDVNMSTVTTLYELFSSDGNIHGVFFQNGKLTYLKHFIRTDKLVFEEKFGKISNNFLVTAFLMGLYEMGAFINIMGLANTAILNVNRTGYYALFERDVPYSLFIDFYKARILTNRKKCIPGVSSLSGHTKYNNVSNMIDTIQYNVLTKCVDYFNMTSRFEILKKHSLYTNYLPLVHDFLLLENRILITDSPFSFKFNRFSKNPVILDNTKPTKIHILNTISGEVETYESPESFYIFHYAQHLENSTHIEIYASVYDKFDYSSISIDGKYRKLVIDKQKRTVSIVKNPALEKYNLDFPIHYKEQIVLRNLFKNTINGFVICNGLEIEDTIFVKNKYICGEHVIKEIAGVPHILVFAYDDLQRGFLLIINMWNSEIIEIALNNTVNIGFHSIFVDPF